MSLLITITLLAMAAAEESDSPEQLLKPRNFNPHPYQTADLLSKFYKHLQTPRPTEQGPVLFPNDAPPPPKPPLIVTARPLEESISRSELNPTQAPLNNSVAQSSYLNKVRILRPSYAHLNLDKPEIYKPDIYNSETYKPDLYKPDAYKPDLYKPDAYKHDLYKPDAYKPDLYNPESYKPDRYNSQSYKSDLYNTDAYEPEYNSKQDLYNNNLNTPELYKPRLYNSEGYKPDLYISDPSYNPRLVQYKNQQPNYGPINFYKKPLIPINADLGKHNLDVASDNYDVGKVNIRHPYAGLVKKSRLLGNQDEHRYNDYEEQTILPPIYKALSNYAQQKVLKSPLKPLPISQPVQPVHQKIKSDHDEYDDYTNDVESESNYGKKYAFSYSVKDQKTGDDFSHSQRSSGSATNGEYRVRLPDGRMQIVSYTADEGGYKADVRYADDIDTSIKPVNDNNIDQQNYQNNKFGLVQTQPRNSNSNEDYYNQYDTKEYYNDNYKYGNRIHYQTTPASTSKFEPIVVNDNYRYDITAPKVTATPNDDGTILITPTRRPYFLSTPKFAIPVEINVPSTTPSSFNLRGGATTERVVNIGGSTKAPIFYTSISNRLSHNNFSPVSVAYSTVSPVTQGYVSSTLAPINSQTPSFVSRLSKYLSFNSK